MIPLILAVLLASPHHAIREEAELALADLGPLAQPALTWAVESPDPERQSRGGRLLDIVCGDSMMPYIDALPDGYPGRNEIIRDYVKRAIEAGFKAQEGKDWPAYREAARLWMLDFPVGPEFLACMRVRSACYDGCGSWGP